MYNFSSSTAYLWSKASLDYAVLLNKERYSSELEVGLI